MLFVSRPPDGSPDRDRAAGKSTECGIETGACHYVRRLRVAETPSLGHGGSWPDSKGREPPNRQLAEALRRAQPCDPTSALVRT
jgi:hypothetical protein